MSDKDIRSDARRIIAQAAATVPNDGPESCARSTDLEVAKWLVWGLEELRDTPRAVREEAIAIFVADIRAGERLKMGRS